MVYVLGGYARSNKIIRLLMSALKISKHRLGFSEHAFICQTKNHTKIICAPLIISRSK